MAPKAHLIPVAVIFILLELVNHGNADDSCRTLDAAFRFRGTLFLVSGSQFFEIDDELREVDTGMMADRFGKRSSQIEAATVWEDDDTLYFFNKDEYFYYSNWFENTYGPYSNSRWTPFFSLSIDAAAKFAHKTYFFKGCYYLVALDGHLSLSYVGQMHDLDLPCDVDAAWEQQHFMVVVKGDQSWVINADGNTRGPIPLSRELSLISVTLCASSQSDNSWSSRMKAELDYERENECVIIDSALNFDGVVYIFNNDSYITLDENGVEAKLSRNYNWGGLGVAIGAALYIEDKEKGYFFQGDEYFMYYVLAFGPFNSVNDWAPFLAGGIDAAGRHRGKTYFFQGCHVAQYDDQDGTVTDIHDSKSIGLPCNINAAFSKDDVLYVIKDDSVWLWNDYVPEPRPLSDFVNLTSWKIC